MRILRFSACVLCALTALPLRGQQTIELPDALVPWRDWVLYGEEYRQCALRDGAASGRRASYVCAWPGTLELDVGEGGAEFGQSWMLAAEDWVPLPGDTDYWPASVAVEGRAQAVVARDGLPALRLPAGTHRVTGTLQWTTRPASIPIPARRA